MSLRYRLVLFFITFAVVAHQARAAAPELRVCADPANMPFSNIHGEGFDNQIARWIAHDLHREIKFVWWTQRSRFVEKNLRAGTCDMVVGVPENSDLMVPSRPYYHSTYTFVSRRDRQLHLRTLHDPALRPLRIGLHVISDDAESVPPAHELAANGMLRNIVGYSLYGHPLSKNPAAELITAVANKDVDVAVAWGPTAGYFAKQSSVALRVDPICPSHSARALPLEYSVSVGVKPTERALVPEINRILTRRSGQIHALLRQYGVPQADPASMRHACGGVR